MKKTVKTIAIILVSAIATAAAGTLTAGAINGFRNNTEATAEEVKVSTNSSFNGEFIGFTCKDSKMDALLAISTADGSDLVESGKSSFIRTNNYYNYYDNTCKAYEEEVIDYDKTTDYTNPVKYTTNVWHTVGYDICDTTGPEFDNDADAKVSHSIMFRDPFDTPYGCSVEYTMGDTKTIFCYFSSELTNPMFESFKGETLKASDKDLYIYQVDEVLFSGTEEEFAAFRMNQKEYNKVIGENIGSLNDDQVIIEEGNSLVKATQIKVNIDMDLSAKIK